MTRGFNFKTKPTTTVSKASTEPTAELTPVATTSTATQSVFDSLPDSAWLRESQLVRSPKNLDSAVAPLPFSAPTLWRMVKAGKFPAPCKLSARVTAWKVSQVREWMTAQAAA
jgi:predicted DNA-binding transcriptional regulator AlpA